MSSPRYVLTAARTAESGGRWWAEIEVNGRVFAAVGATLRDVAAALRAKVEASGGNVLDLGACS